MAHPGSGRMCSHLVGAACDQARPEGTKLALVEVCAGCIGGDFGYVAGWRGERGIDERPEPFDAAVMPTRLLAELPG